MEAIALKSGADADVSIRGYVRSGVPEIVDRSDAEECGCDAGLVRMRI